MSARTPIETDNLLTPSEVAQMFRVDPKTVTRWAKAGKLSTIRTLGGHRRYKEAEVRALLAGTPAPGAPDPLDASLTSLWPAFRTGPAVTIQRRLETAGFNTVGKLKGLSALDLDDLGFSRPQVDEVRLALAKAGLALHGEVLSKVA